MSDLTRYDHFRLMEAQTVRSELNSKVHALNGHENFTAATVSAIYAFILTNRTAEIELVMSIVSIVITLLGVFRYIELSRRIVRMEIYLREIEKEFVDKGGWSQNSFAQSSGIRRYVISPSRPIFWLTMIFIVTSGFIYIILSIYLR